MVKAAPLVRSFNAGEFSALVEARTDLERYPASCRALFNAVATPQGPVVCRGGSTYVNDAFDHTKLSVLVPFVFSETDFYMIEFAHNRVRFFTETGLLTYTPVAITAMSTGPFTFTSATLGAAIGEQVVFSDFPDYYNLNGVVANITNKVGNVYTVDVAFPALASITTYKVARVYHIASPYTSSQIIDVRDTASLDVVYLFNEDVKTYKLQRSDTYSWAFVAVDFIDGPYLPEVEGTTTLLTPNGTGKATPDMTSTTAPSGTVTASGDDGTNFSWHAFDASANKTFWGGNADQAGWIAYAPATPFVCDGYSIQMAIGNTDTSYTSKDYAPSNFQFEGYNGASWVILDSQRNYVLYDNNKSVFFKIPNTTAYQAYRLTVDSLVRNGGIKPRIRSLIMRSPTSVSLQITASAVTDINNGQGFLTTDVGRLIRMRGSDGAWRSLKITARSSTTVVTATLLGEPFPDLQGCSKWRLGAYSDTTGYASSGAFHDDRLWCFSTKSFPDFFAHSASGSYEDFSPTTSSGEVLATNGGSNRLNSRRLSKIKWGASGKDGLALGTGSKEYMLRSRSSTSKNLNPKDGFDAVDSGSRGSADVAPAEVDAQVLFVGRGGRSVREFAYNFENDGYKSPSMSSLASHLGISPFVRQAYAAEPFGIDWVLRQDGLVVGLTYNRDENVIGWHRHDFNGVVESIAVLPATDQLQDILWMVIRRTINGQDRRYIEKLSRFWDFNSTIEEAHFVDCALRYDGAPVTEVYGLQHLEGREDIYGVADNIPVGPLTVEDGMVALDFEASSIILGIGFESYGETQRLENGATDGTAQGKTKRFNAMLLHVWKSCYGEFGTWNNDTQEVEWVPVEYRGTDGSVLETNELFTGIVGPFTPAPGYDRNGSVYFRRTKDKPMPFNLIAFMPTMVTQDGG